MKQERLKELLNYNPETGTWTWLVTLGSRAIKGAQAGTINSGYVYIVIDGKPYSAHRLAFLYMKGYFPKEVDHIDLDRSNNKWSNLREVTRAQNQSNRIKLKNNTSGYKGVTWHKQRKKWVARIQNKHLGVFDNIDEAIKSYNKAALECYGEFARLN